MKCVAIAVLISVLGSFAFASDDSKAADPLDKTVPHFELTDATLLVASLNSARVKFPICILELKKHLLADRRAA